MSSGRLLRGLAVNLLFLFRNADWFEAAGIAAAVFLATLISTLSEYGSESAFLELQKKALRLREQILPPDDLALAASHVNLASACHRLNRNREALDYLLRALRIRQAKLPENYPDLIVRVTGFSAKFTSLSPEWQQEVLSRNFYD